MKTAGVIDLTSGSFGNNQFAEIHEQGSKRAPELLEVSRLSASVSELNFKPPETRLLKRKFDQNEESSDSTIQSDFHDVGLTSPSEALFLPHPTRSRSQTQLTITEFARICKTDRVKASSKRQRSDDDRFVGAAEFRSSPIHVRHNWIVPPKSSTVSTENSQIRSDVHLELNSDDNHRDTIFYVSDTEEQAEIESTASNRAVSEEFLEVPEVIDLLDDDRTLQDALTTNEEVIKKPIKFENMIARRDGVSFKTSITCANNKVVEFVNGAFMRIKSMVVNKDGERILIGQYFVRQNFFQARVPKRRNEVVWVMDNIPAQNDGLVRRSLRQEDIVRNRKLIITNRAFPKDYEDPNHPRNHLDAYANLAQDVAYGPLFCRLKRYTTSEGGRSGRLTEEIWAAISESESDPDPIARVTDKEKRDTWRGKTSIGGDHEEAKTLYDADCFRMEGNNVLNVRKYTFGDAFCGAGGTSCGARLAGLHNVWSFDYDSKAVQTYRLNFPGVQCLNQAVHEFIGEATKPSKDRRVDVLHISPPCQPFSPAHTIPSQERDEANEAALLSVGQLLDIVKPRVVTIEQTFGLVSRHSEWFWALIHDFNRTGYSLHWKVIDCSDYGIPQSRRRLVIIGAGPGEALPEFPKPTHGIGPGLLQIPTIRKVLQEVKQMLRPYNHDRSRIYRVRRSPISPNQLAKTITTNGGVGNQHPSGLRPYTVREFATFQTFPASFRFAEVGITHQKRQVGNAVPPRMAKVLYKEIIRSLKKTDGVE